MSVLTESKYGTLWSREELILALYLYCQTPFAKTKANNPDIIQVAKMIGRTPSSVARKLGNFGAFDPLLAQKGIVGLAHYSKADKEIWKELYQHWDRLVEASEAITAATQDAASLATVAQHEAPPIIADFVLPIGPTSQPKLVMTRLYQSFFRKAVLSSYQNACCMCGINFPQLLIASHIKPWALSEETRTDPENGLCLCVLHDKAYDRGLMTVSAEHEIYVSKVVTKSKVDFVDTALTAFQGQKITLPSRFAPKPEYLTWHQQKVFQG